MGQNPSQNDGNRQKLSVAIKTAALVLRLVLRATSTLSEKCDQMIVDGIMMRVRLKIISLLISYGKWRRQKIG